MVSSTGTSTYLDGFGCDLTYNPVAFGTQAVSNGRVKVTRGSAFNTLTYINPQSVLVGGEDTLSIAFYTGQLYKA